MTHNQTAVIFILLLLSGSPAFSTNIKGGVYDRETKEYLSCTSVLLLTTDSAFVTGTTTDSEGKFTIAGNFPVDDYRLRITILSQYDYFVELEQLDSDVNLDNIFLTPKSAELEEVVIKSQSIIYGSNSQTYIPAVNQKKQATDGIDLLNSMMIKGISVDIVSESITKSGGGNLRFCINGRNVSQAELKSINPEDVLRVEYYDYPWRKYASDNHPITGIINVTVKKRETGGYFATNTQTAVTTGFGNEQIVSKTNFRNSEFSLIYGLNFRDYSKRRVNIEENYQLPSVSFKRNLEGVNAPYKYQIHNIGIAYNIQDNDKWMFNAAVKNNITDRSNELKQNISRPDASGDPSSATSEAKTMQHIPSADLYGQIKINDSENLYLNIVGSFLQTKFQEQYISRNLTDTLFSLYTHVDGQKKSVIGEGIYEKTAGEHVLTCGIKYIFSSSKNIYEQSSTDLTRMEQSDLYSFISLSQSKRFSYEVSAGASGISNRQNSESSTTYYFQSTLYLGYRLNAALNLKYHFYIAPVIPAPGRLNDVVQETDDIWMQKGNPGLKPNNEYKQSLSLFYDKNNLSTEINHETVCKIIRRDSEQGGTLFRHARHQLKNRKRPVDSKISVKNRISVDLRPETVNTKERFGDREIDTVAGKNNKGAIVTAVERKTAFMMMEKLEYGKNAKQLSKAAVRLLTACMKNVQTVTGNSGTEFADRQSVAKSLKTGFLFTLPFSSWEKGLIENTNKLIRQYIPEQANFNDFNEQQIKKTYNIKSITYPKKN